MSWTDLVPWGRSRSVATRQTTDEGEPLIALHREMNRLFDDFARGFGFGAPTRFGFQAGGWPNLEVTETDAEVKIVAELPGLEQKDVEVTFSDGVLTLAGEKKAESEGPLYSERWHGQFRRSLRIGPEVDAEKVSAAFKNGVLTVTMAKRPEAQTEARRIPITS